MMLEALTAKGDGSSNEDCFGYALDRVWVLDGATQLVPDRLGGNETDAATFAHLTSHLLGTLVTSTMSNREVLTRALKAADASLAISTKFAQEMHYQPSFAMAMVQLCEDWVDIDVLSDCYVVGFYGSRIRVATDKRIERISQATESARKRAISEEDDSQFVKEQMVHQIHRNRRRMNVSGGYWVGTADTMAVSHTHQERWPLQSLEKLLICSDGYWDAVASPNGPQEFLESDPDLVAALRAMRVSETRKVDGSDGPRSKKHDDATVVVIYR